MSILLRQPCLRTNVSPIRTSSLLSCSYKPLDCSLLVRILRDVKTASLIGNVEGRLDQVSRLRRAKAHSGRGKFVSISCENIRVTGAQDLFEYIETLASKLKEAEDELRDKKDVVKLTRRRVEEAEKHVQECRIEKVGVLFIQAHNYNSRD